MLEITEFTSGCIVHGNARSLYYALHHEARWSRRNGNEYGYSAHDEDSSKILEALRIANVPTRMWEWRIG